MVVHMHENTRGILLKLLAIAIFALMDAFLKQLSYHYSPIQVVFLRGLMALPFVTAMLFWQGAVPQLKTRYWPLHLLRGVFGVAMLMAFIYSFSKMNLADVYAIYYASPLFVTLLSIVFLKERVGRHRWIAIFIGMLTVIFMMKPGSGSISWPALAALFSTVTYAVLIIIMKVLHRHESTIIQAFYFTLAITCGAGLLTIPSWQALQWTDAWLLFGLGFTGASAQFIMTEAYRHAQASLLTPYEYSALIWGITFGFIFWREIPTPSMLIGACVVAATGLYIWHRERQHEKFGEKIIHPPAIDKP